MKIILEYTCKFVYFSVNNELTCSDKTLEHSQYLHVDAFFQ